MAENQTKRGNTSVPPAILVHESHFLHALCQQDRGELTKAGVVWTDVESLPGLCKRCSNLYALYRVEKIEIAAHKKRLRNLFKASIRVRSMVAGKIRHVLKLSGSKKQLPVYHRRRAPAEIIQDLNDLAGFCTVLQPELNAIGFKSTRVEAVKKCALLRQREYSAVNKMGIDTRELRLEYLDAYRSLYIVVQTIRDKALAHFPKSSPRRAGYISQYHKSRK